MFAFILLILCSLPFDNWNSNHLPWNDHGMNGVFTIHGRLYINICIQIFHGFVTVC
uniref:Uncharacterized protein n=1 Tax=Rhizophora mucronata TaxID=61149 RepID=A0A2P2PML7_RHIMU